MLQSGVFQTSSDLLVLLHILFNLDILYYENIHQIDNLGEY